MQQRVQAPAETNVVRLAAQAARAVPGVASVADSDVQVQMVAEGMAQVACTLTAGQNTKLHEVGVAVQLAIATVLKRAVGLEVRSVNIYIIDIDERATRPRASNPLGKKRHYG